MTNSSERKEAGEARKLEVLKLRRAGLQFEEIGRRLDPPCSKQAAWQMWNRAVQGPRKRMASSIRDEIDDSLMDLVRRVYAVLNGESVTPEQLMAGVREVRQIGDQRARLHGANAPVKIAQEADVHVEYTIVGVDADKDLT